MGRFFVGLTAVHISVALLWRVPRLRSFLARHTAHSALSGLNHTMITAGFTSVTSLLASRPALMHPSHLSFIHLAGNSIVLYTFSSGLEWIGESGGPESHWTNDVPHILAFYTVAGVSGLYPPNVASSIVYRRRILSLPASATVFNVEPAALCPAAGASASVSAVVALAALAAGDPSSAMLSVAGCDISWAQGLSALVARDLLKHLFARQSSAAEHLSGALFGCVYYYVGPRSWAFTRDVVGNRHTWVVTDADAGVYRAFVRDRL
ncbi:hypothetical protein AURDEDRAFT_160640 [Auricularia subglabra TFB-10046 SS5]|nr:hypothetical protein AURDEDRAFT_160640 [Auricularia subglabra TFB-10046 SS5]